MRTYGRTYNEDGTYQWVVVTTTPQGQNDELWAVTLAQCLQLNLGESPFFANYGIPAQTSVLSQIAPDYNVMLTQQQFAPYFASLIINKLPTTPPSPPEYDVNAVTSQGFVFNFSQLPR